MKIKLLLLSLLAITFVACNSSNESCDKEGATTEEGMKCCKDAAAKGEKCAKCNHGEASDSSKVAEKACCKEAKEKGEDCAHCAKKDGEGDAAAACCPEGKSCDKCADGEKACCKDAKAEGKECSKCAHS